MLNLVMTHSPRLAATLNNKRFGADVESNPAIRHRLSWLRREHAAETNAYTTRATETALRERTA